MNLKTATRFPFSGSKCLETCQSSSIAHINLSMSKKPQSESSKIIRLLLSLGKQAILPEWQADKESSIYLVELSTAEAKESTPSSAETGCTEAKSSDESGKSTTNSSPGCEKVYRRKVDGMTRSESDGVARSKIDAVA